MANCSICNAELQPDELKEWKGPDGNPVLYCKKCLETINNDLAQQTQNLNIPMALLYGIGASIVTGFLWYVIVTKTNTIFDIAAIALGFAIAYAVCKGAGDKKGIKLQAITIALIILTFLVSDGMTGLNVLAKEEGMSIMQYFTKDGITGIIANLIFLPRSAILVTGFMGYLFKALAIYVAFVFAAPDKLQEYKATEQK